MLSKRPLPVEFALASEGPRKVGISQRDVLNHAFSFGLDASALRRIRATPRQAFLGRAERERNLRGAFAYAPRRKYDHVAIVDDIVTTGSTADEITRVLHRAGVEYVEVWALARVYRR